jgi:hypothetical protein
MGWDLTHLQGYLIFHILTQLLVQRVEMDTKTIGHGWIPMDMNSYSLVP